MAISSMVKARGLYTFQNYLSHIPEGALFEASNVVIDRDGIIEPRRGFKVFSDLSGSAKQLLYPILLHQNQRILQHLKLEKIFFLLM
jgi:hypothetical protein